MNLPTITIVTRHKAGCKYADDPLNKICRCWRSLRWFGDPFDTADRRVHYEATHERTWAGASRVMLEKQKVWEEQDRGVTPAPKSSVAGAVELYIADKKQQGLETGTVKKNSLTVNRLRDFCDLQGISLVAGITSAHLIAFRSTWDWYTAAESRRNEQTRLRSFFRWCLKNDFVTKNPASSLSPIKGDRVPTMPYEPEEMKAIIAACSQCEFTDYRAKRVRALALLMRHSGLSIIDAASLAREELQLRAEEYCVVRRRLKNDNLVNNRIPNELAIELLAVPNSSQKYFFWSGKGTEKSIAGKFTNDLQKVFAKAEIPDGHPHRFRDTAAVELLKAGVDIRDVQKFLGHKSLATTEKYYAPWNKRQQDIFSAKIKAAQQTMELHI